ncbi:MAG: DUF4411 family protein [Planctomycetota bacterium]
MAKYVLDANVLIEAKRLYYAFDLCPGFWDSLLYHNSNGNLESIDRVGKDLAEGDDLDAWKKESPGFFAPTESASILTAYRDVNQWVQSQERFSNFEKSKFADDVDAWVIAYAKANNATVVTHEVSAPRSRKVKIPDVCDHFNIEHINTFGMLQRLGVVFGWEAP